MGNIKIKRWDFWMTLFCLACIFIFKSSVIDINSVKAAVLKQVVKIDRNNVKAYCFLADHYDQSQDFEEAVKWYTKAAEHGDSDAYCNLGVAYREPFTMYYNPSRFSFFCSFFMLPFP